MNRQNMVIHLIDNSQPTLGGKRMNMRNFSMCNWMPSALRSLTGSAALVIACGLTLLALGTVDVGQALAANDGRVLYSNNTTTPQQRTYANGTNTFAAGSASIVGAIPTHMVQKTAPTRNERLVGYVTTTGVLYIYRWNGTAWTNETSAGGGWGGTVTVGGDGINGRRFDIVYEKTSGRAMVVYSGNVATTNELRYRIWDGATWTAATNLDSARLTGIATSIKLAARPTTGSNEIALTVCDMGTATANTAKLTSLIWSGSAWGNEPAAAHATNMYSVITTGLVQNDLFDLAYEGVSGDLMLVFTRGTPNQCYRTYSAGVWGTLVTTLQATGRAGPLQMVAVGNPNSDQILIAYNRGANTSVFGHVWDGTTMPAFTTIGTTGLNPTAINKKHIAGGWVRSGSTDAAVVTWTGAAATTQPTYYNTYTAGAWGTATSWASGATITSGNPAWMDIDTDDDRLILTFADSNSDLWAKRCVFTAPSTFTWTNADAGAALIATLTNATSKNFAFSFNIDFTPPIEGTLSVTSSQSGLFVKSPLTFQETFTDAESDVKSCEYTTDGSSWSAGAVSGTKPNFTCTASAVAVVDGTPLTLEMRATSSGGVSTVANSLARTADALAPTTLTDYAGPSIVDLNITLSATDGTGVGVNSILYCQDAINTCSPVTTYAAPVAVTGTAGAKTVKYLRYAATDLVTNAETVTSTTITIDKRTGTEVLPLSFSSVSYSGLTVNANFSGDQNGNNGCTIKWGTSLGTYPNTATAVKSAGKYSAVISGLAENTMYYCEATFTDPETILAGTNPSLGSQKTLVFTVGHNSTLSGSSYWAGNWGGGGGKYGAFSCNTCHAKGSTNIKRLKTSFVTPDATLWASSGAASVAVTATAVDYGSDNLTHVSSAKPCEVCHSQTYIHNYNQATAERHGDVTDCMTCHKHDGGFAPGGSCERCHDLNAPNTRAPKVVDKSGALYNGEAYGGHLKALKTNVLSAGTNWDTQCRNCHGMHTGAVQIPNNTVVGINYTRHGGIWFGGTATTMTTEAEICWECHAKVANNVSEWGVNTDTNTATYPNYNLGTISGTGNWIGATWTSANFAYKTGAILSTHTANPSVLGGPSTTANHGGTNPDTVAQIRCSYCHDVHNTATALTTDVDNKPYLRGSWKGNPYREDGAPRDTNTYATYTTGYGLVPRGGTAYVDLGGFQIDQNNGNPTATAAWTAGGATGFGGLCELCHNSGTSDGTYAATEINALNQFGTASTDWMGTNGHANSVLGGDGTGAVNVFSNTDRNATAPTFGTGDGISAGNPAMAQQQTIGGYAYSFRPPTSYATEGWNLTPRVGGQEVHSSGSYTWGATVTAANPIDIAYHKFTCSKCHNPHASRLPRLMITNCLDTDHNTWDTKTGVLMVPATTVASGNTMYPNISSASMPLSQSGSAQNCHRVRDASYANSKGAGWNKVTPWVEFP